MTTRKIIGSIILFLGIAFLLDRLQVFIIHEIISDWWPLVLIVIGLMQISSNKKSVISGIFVILIGFILLFNNLGYLPVSMWSIVWPLALVMFGLSMLTSSYRKKARVKGSTKDTVNTFTLFAGNEDNIISDSFKGGNVTTIFGGTEIDLRKSIISAEGANLELTAIFGGIKIIVPENWEVQTSGTPFMGALDNKTYPIHESDAIPQVLNIHYFTAFGGIEIKNYGKRKKI